MGYFFWWVVLSVVVGAVGSGRRIGFLVAFIFSLLFSPLIGVIIVALSKSKSTIAFEKQMLAMQKQQTDAAKRLSPEPLTLSELLDELKQKRDKGEISSI